MNENVLTEQEIFDTVVNHLRKQKIPAMENSSCKYRTSAGLKCAVGILIEDEEYASWMDSDTTPDTTPDTTIDSVINNYDCPKTLSNRLSSHLRLLGKLQNIHDAHILNWEQALEELALDYSLIYNHE